MQTSIAGCQVKETLGKGGMGTVFLAVHPIEGDVAIKVLPKEFLHDDSFHSRFRKEIQVLRSLSHAAIVEVIDAGEDDGQPWLMMRWMRGGSLADKLKKGPLSMPEVARILSRLAPALDTAHQKGVIHRDLKPGNILFDSESKPYLADFGIAKIQAETKMFTAPSGIIGTPAYMSPEQANKKKGTSLDGRSDLYSLGVIVFESLAGLHPYHDYDGTGLLIAHIQVPVPNIVALNQNLPLVCNEFLLKAMAKKPEDRFDTAKDMADVFAKLTMSSQPKISVVRTSDPHDWIAAPTALGPRAPSDTTPSGTHSEQAPSLPPFEIAPRTIPPQKQYIGSMPEPPPFGVALSTIPPRQSSAEKASALLFGIAPSTIPPVKTDAGNSLPAAKPTLNPPGKPKEPSSALPTEESIAAPAVPPEIKIPPPQSIEQNELPEQKKKPYLLRAAIGVPLLVWGGITLFGGSPPETARTTTQPATMQQTTSQPATEPAIVEPGKEGKVTLRIKTNPPGATITVDKTKQKEKTKAGKEMKIELNQDEKKQAKVSVNLAGHLTQEFTVALDKDWSQNVALEERFVKNVDGSVTDKLTKLTWAGKDNGSNATFGAAKSYIAGLGDGWRMPTINELKGLYAANITDCTSGKLIKMTGCGVWASDTQLPSGVPACKDDNDPRFCFYYDCLVQTPNTCSSGSWAFTADMGNSGVRRNDRADSNYKRALPVRRSGD